MYTKCPHCKTVFQVGAGQLRAAAGKVRCGTCQCVFNSLEALTDEWPGPPEDDDEPSTPGTGEDDHEGARHSPDSSPLLDLYDRGEASRVVPPEPAPAPSMLLDEDQQDAETVLPTHTGLWAAGVLLLLAAFLVQVAWYSRNELSQIAATRPMLDRICAPLGCQLPPWRDTSQIAIRDQDIRQYGDTGTALIVNITMENNASLAQPLPGLLIEFLRLDSSVISSRRLLPEEYGPGELAPRYLMAPGVPVHAVMQLASPGKETTGYRFDIF